MGTIKWNGTSTIFLCFEREPHDYYPSFVYAHESWNYFTLLKFPSHFFAYPLQDSLLFMISFNQLVSFHSITNSQLVLTISLS